MWRVGNPKDFGTPLASLGMNVQPIDLTIPEPKQEAAKATPESLAKGKALLARVQQAFGGADKLAAVKDLQFHANLEVFTPGRIHEGEANQSRSSRLPGSARTTSFRF